MKIWHGTDDTPRVPLRVAAGERVRVLAGTWPVEPAQAVELVWHVQAASGVSSEGRAPALWQHNERGNSYWRAQMGPFADGDVVTYHVEGRSLHAADAAPRSTFRVAPKLRVALLWHQHQPLYLAPGSAVTRQPWVRLHALRDYYSMASLVAAHPPVHVTINLTPSLLVQIDDYVAGGVDRAMELSSRRVRDLTAAERHEMQASFFDADRHGQIAIHARYDELFVRSAAGVALDDQELVDLAMWFNLAWFGAELRAAPVELVTGETVDVHRFIEQGRGFSHADVLACLDEQRKVLRAVVPIHRLLQDRGQIEVTTTPFYHPILPLLVDTDRANLDRSGTTLPRRFAWPEDADAQVERSVRDYARRFGRPPRGMWPAEGAVASFVVPLFARHGVRWIATDQGVLAKSGRFGYDTSDPDVVCRPYRAEEGDDALAVFFRDTRLSDAIGFSYQHYADPAQAARDFIDDIERRIVPRLRGEGERVVPVILDGENAWGGYRDDARPFLHALYAALAGSTTIGTTTFSEALDASPTLALDRVYELYTGSWIDERSSAPGVDLGTWIGEPEENLAWELLGDARSALAAAPAGVEGAGDAFDAVYAAEGSDWFWWFGDDQDSGHDELFDELFRAHLARVYRALGRPAPAELSRRIIPVSVVWRPGAPVQRLQPGDRLLVRNNCPGVLEWGFDDKPMTVRELSGVGGVMGGGIPHYQLAIGPVPRDAGQVRFVFHCTRSECTRASPPCDGVLQVVPIAV